MTIEETSGALGVVDKKTQSSYVYSPAIFRGIAQFVDFSFILAAGVICYVLMIGFNQYNIELYACCMVFVAFVTVLIFRQIDLYEIDALMRPVSRSDFFILALAAAFVFFLSLTVALKVSTIFSRLWILSFAASSFAAIFIARGGMYAILSSLSRRGVMGRNLAVFGSGEQARMFLDRTEQVKPYFTNVVGVYADNSGDADQGVAGHKVLGDAEALLQDARAQRIDDVVVALPWTANESVISTIERLKELPVNVYISSDLLGFHLNFRPAVGHTQALPMFEVVRRPISGWSSLLKSVLDFVLAAFFLALLSPLLILTAIAIKLNSPGPVLFVQKRLGFNNQVFHIYKFRSMAKSESVEGKFRQATKNDMRVTRVGRVIRRMSIDELPQLLNVLNGTMSIVGPRPHVVSQNEDYARQIRGYFTRHKVKPGITGWAQVNGLRGETDSLDKMEARVQHDIYYAENWSLMFDVRILVQTILVLLFQKNAY